MKISVIVPFWNSEKWLGRCCESLTKQDGDFEFILVDDKSTDNGKYIAGEYCISDARFRLYANIHGKGVSGARNTGIDYATGEWVTFLDADDELMPNAYKIYRHVIAEDDRANIHHMCHARYNAVRNTTTIAKMQEGVYCFGKLPTYWFGVWNKLYRREFLQGIRFVEGLQYGEDGLFALETFAKDDYIHCSGEKFVAVKHRFDNKDSLSKKKTADDIHKQLQAYDEFYSRQTKKIVRIEVAQEISTLWGHRLIKAIQDE